MGASVVELTAANADVASLTIGGARLALTVISAHVRRAAGVIGITLSAQGFTCLGIVLALQSHVREVATGTVIADHLISVISAALTICFTSIASCHVHVRKRFTTTILADKFARRTATRVRTSIALANTKDKS